MLGVDSYSMLIDFVSKLPVVIAANIIVYSEPFLMILKDHRGVLRLFPATLGLAVRENVVLDLWVYTRYKIAKKVG